MKKRLLILAASLVMISVMLGSCALIRPASTADTDTPAAHPAEDTASTEDVSTEDVSDEGVSDEDASEIDMSGEGEFHDPSLDLIGRWSNVDIDVVTQFYDDGTYETWQNGAMIISDTYMAEIVDDNTLLIKTGQDQSFEVVFIDEYTFQSEGATMVRVTQDESIPEYEDSGFDPESLIIGIWVSDEGFIEFDAFGTLTVVENNNEDISSYPYTIETIDDSTIEITITDFDGSTSSETAFFEDTATMIMGDTTYIREID